MAAPENQIVPIEEITTFYAIAYTNFLRVERLVAGRLRYEGKVAREGRKWTEEDLDFLTLNHLNPADEERLAVVTVIFSALALEALINDYAISNSSKTHFENYLDISSTPAKWVIFPWLFVGKHLDTDRQTFERLKNLFRLRNRFVHFKRSKEPQPDRGEKDRITKHHAARAVHTVRMAVAQLKRLDPRVSTLWLRETEDACTD